MHDAEFADAFRPPIFKVLGLPLLDYTIGHELLLWQRRNILVTENAEGRRQNEEGRLVLRRALCQAVLICCRRQPWVRLWALKCRGVNLDEEVAEFRRYRFCGSRDLPTVQMPKMPGGHYHYFGAPELARMINYVEQFHGQMIIRHFDGSALNFPFGLARMLYLAHAESEGAVWVENFNDARDKERLKLFEEANPESTVAIGDEAIEKLAREWDLKHPGTPIPEALRGSGAK